MVFFFTTITFQFPFIICLHRPGYMYKFLECVYIVMYVCAHVHACVLVGMIKYGGCVYAERVCIDILRSLSLFLELNRYDHLP